MHIVWNVFPFDWKFQFSTCVCFRGQSYGSLLLGSDLMRALTCLDLKSTATCIHSCALLCSLVTACFAFFMSMQSITLYHIMFVFAGGLQWCDVHWQRARWLFEDFDQVRLWEIESPAEKAGCGPVWAIWPSIIVWLFLVPIFQTSCCWLPMPNLCKAIAPWQLEALHCFYLQGECQSVLLW